MTFSVAPDAAPENANVHQYEIDDESAGQRLDVFLAAQLGVSRGRAQKLVEHTTINNEPAKSSQTLKNGDRVLVREPEAQPEIVNRQSPIVNSDLPPFLYEDDDLMVLNKPRGVVIHAGAGETGATLVDILRAHNRTLSSVGPPERSGIVHRLDKDTTGVIVVCKTDAAHWKLAADFAERRVQKNYLALVCGVPPKLGRIEAPIFRHPRDRKKMMVMREGRPSITEYSIVQPWQKYALLDVDLLTGRTHQIRVHLSYINHPVVGDAVYGGYKRALETAPNQDVRTALQQLKGQALHAAKLQFTHPTNGEEMTFEAAVPEDFGRVLDSLNE
ncbi:MAG TPA: RluA family pseudouridine synthase [Abditibacteriaceae bacterium]|nr:RluA family pseudouridine synthase [Abditibacteriaceae bacterium]